MTSICSDVLSRVFEYLDVPTLWKAVLAGGPLLAKNAIVDHYLHSMNELLAAVLTVKIFRERCTRCITDERPLVELFGNVGLSVYDFDHDNGEFHCLAVGDELIARLGQVEYGRHKCGNDGSFRVLDRPNALFPIFLAALQLCDPLRQECSVEYQRSDYTTYQFVFGKSGRIASVDWLADNLLAAEEEMTYLFRTFEAHEILLDKQAICRSISMYRLLYRSCNKTK